MQHPMLLLLLAASPAIADNHILTLPGLVADRAAQRVELEAEATGLESGEIVEFFIIGPKSGKDYEALFVSRAAAGDIHRALEFIGIPAGRAIDYGRDMFWPKGERVIATCDGVRIENLLLDRKTAKPLEAAGLVFVGSRLDGGEYAADQRDPYSIASDFNHPETVLDVPRLAQKSAVYNTMVVHSDHVYRKGQSVTIILEPEHRDGSRRVADIQLTARPDSRGISFTADGNANGMDYRQLMRRMQGLVAQGIDPFVSLSYDEDLSLAQAQMVSRMLLSMESDRGIRIEPPPEGQLFYKAFHPNPRYRDRDHRSLQPWELHLYAGGTSVTGNMVEIRESWTAEKTGIERMITDHPAFSGNDVRATIDEAARKEFNAAIDVIRDDNKRTELSKRLDELSNEDLWVEKGDELENALRSAGQPLRGRKFLKTRILIVYADPSITYGQLMQYIRPALSTHSTVHVFLR